MSELCKVFGVFISWYFMPTSGESDHLKWGNIHKYEVVFINITGLNCVIRNWVARISFLFCHESSPLSVLSCTSPNGHGNDNNSLRWILLLLEDTDFSLPQRPEDQWKAYRSLYYVFIDATYIAWPYTVHGTRHQDSAPSPRIHILGRSKMLSKYEILL